MIWWLLACSGDPVDSNKGGGDSTSGATDSAPESSDSSPDPIDSIPADTGLCSGAPTLSWDGWGDGFFTTYCRACHSATTPDRHGAPEGIDFDTEDQVRTGKELIRASVLTNGTMPVGGGVLPDELTLLEIYLDCWL